MQLYFLLTSYSHHFTLLSLLITAHYLSPSDMAGFYKSNYSDADGNKKVMASTQFEALDARRYMKYSEMSSRR